MARKRRHYRTPVTVQYLDTTRSTDFEPPAPEWQTAFTDRADFAALRPSEQVVAQQLHAGATGKAYFRWSRRWADLVKTAATVRLVDTDGQVWSVISAVNHDDENREAVAMVKRTTVFVEVPV